MPTEYLNRYKSPSPYTAGWAEALDDALVKTKSQVSFQSQSQSNTNKHLFKELMRSHILHPAIIWRDAEQELSEANFWFHTELPQIASEATMLELRNAKLGSYYRHPEYRPSKDTTGVVAPDSASGPLHKIQLLTPNQASEHFSLSFDDMVNTSVALKSGLNVDIKPPSSSWAKALFPDLGSASPAPSSIALPALQDSTSNESRDPRDSIPSYVKQALASLQREVFMLRNELNFELWLSRENVKHIGRLYQDRIGGKRQEAERMSTVSCYVLG
jgi:hypothetical protein